MSKLAAFAKKNGIKYFLVSFTDLRGAQRSKLVPSVAIGEMEKEGAGFAGFSVHLDMTPAYPDMFAIPDVAGVVQLPWKPEVAWVPGDLYMNGVLVAQAPRNVLRAVLEQAHKVGFKMKTGVEAEFFLLSPEGDVVSDAYDVEDKPCYDQSALMRRYDVVAEICDAMQSLGWEPYQNDHEDANGQFEMNWTYDDALVTADRHAFFKFMVKSIAERHGLRATFMPKPFAHLTGNGCHAHISLWSRSGDENLFSNARDEMGLSKIAYQFLAGVLHHAPSLCAITNPIVNSYKRINAPVTASGATWSPNTVTWSGNNRTHMVRIPDAGRIEVRLADGATNPYLIHAAYMAAGLDGIVKEREPGKRLDIDMYAEGHKVRVRRLPLYLLDATRLFQANKALRAVLGDEFCDAFIKMQNGEWETYSQHLSDWERQHSLNI